MAAKSVKSAEAKWNYGAKIVVQVENKFENGVVVSFVDVDGIEYRGALLSQSNVPHRSQREALVKVQRANPLSFLHDHPYSNLSKYAKHLSTNIPAEVLLQWNSPPPVPPLSDKSHPISMRQRKNMFDLREYDKYNETLNRSGLPSRHVRSAIVCVEPVKDPLYLSHSSRLSGIRQAKEVAHTRLENQRKKLYRKKRLVYKNSHETRQLKTQYSEKQRKRESRPLKLETNKKIKLVEVKVKKKVNSLTSDLSLIELLEHSREADQLLTVSSNVVKTSTPELNACHRDMVSIEDVHERPSLESKNQTLGIRNFSIRLVKIPFKFIT